MEEDIAAKTLFALCLFLKKRAANTYAEVTAVENDVLKHFVVNQQKAVLSMQNISVLVTGVAKDVLKPYAIALLREKRNPMESLSVQNTEVGTNAVISSVGDEEVDQQMQMDTSTVSFMVVFEKVVKSALKSVAIQ